MKFGHPLKVCELYAGTARSVEPFRSSQRAEVALLVDANDLALKVYQANYGDAPYKQADLSVVNPSDILAWAGQQIDVLLGCPPCQGFSENGPRRADDPRNQHVRRYAEFALAMKPRAVVMENVPLAAASPEFRWMTEALESAGFVWTAMIANAAQYGSAQSRQRLLFVAVDRNRGDRPEFPRPTHGAGRLFSYSAGAERDVASDIREMLGISPATQRLARMLPQDYSTELGPKPALTVGDMIGDLPGLGSDEALQLDHLPRQHGADLLERMRDVPEGGRPVLDGRFFSHSYGRLHRRGLSRTITNFFWHAGAGRYWHPTEPRTLTMREAARLQGFDDRFRFGAVSRRASTLVGNALDAALASVCHDTIQRALQPTRLQ